MLILERLYLFVEKKTSFFKFKILNIAIVCYAYLVYVKLDAKGMKLSRHKACALVKDMTEIGGFIENEN